MAALTETNGQLELEELHGASAAEPVWTAITHTPTTVTVSGAEGPVSESEGPVSARGRRSGSKKCWNLAEKITESEKVIRSVFNIQ